MIPKAAGSDALATNPCVANLKNALDKLDDIGSRSVVVFEEAVQKITNLNILEDLMKVH